MRRPGDLLRRPSTSTGGGTSQRQTPTARVPFIGTPAPRSFAASRRKSSATRTVRQARSSRRGDHSVYAA